MSAADLIEIMTKRITRHFDVIQIVLFGSHARGAEGCGSDVDLLVVLPEVDDKRRAAVQMRRLLSDLPVAKDIIVTTPDEIARRGHLAGSIIRTALREGKVIHGGVPPPRHEDGGPDASHSAPPHVNAPRS